MRTILLPPTLLLACAAVQAGVTLDGSLGPAGAIGGPHYQIGADLGRQAGPNLFHSFGTFSLNRGESATFTGPASVNRVIGRVTGGEVSFIDGTLSCTIPGADLYLINPSGLIFGENALLDLPGSFYAATADHLLFADGLRFPAAGALPPASLSMADPVAFGFLGANQGRIEAAGQGLAVPDGRTLALVAGEIALYTPESRLTAEDGRLLLLAAREGQVGLDGSLAGRGGDIDVSGGLRLDATGDAGGGEIVIRGGRIFLADTIGYAQDTDADRRGAITLAADEQLVLLNSVFQSWSLGSARGGQIELTAPQMSLTRSSIDVHATAEGDAGSIRVEAGRLSLDDSGLGATTEGSGRGGSVRIEAESARFSGGALVSVTTTGEGAGGEISVQVAGRLFMTGAMADDIWTGLFASTTASGDAGRIEVAAGELVLDDASFIAGTGGSGRGGDISVSAGTIELIRDGQIAARVYEEGPGGDISVRADRLILTDGGEISTESFSHDAAGGAIDVEVGESITMVGRGEEWQSPGSDAVSTGIFSYGGDISVRAPVIHMEQSSAISTRTWNNLAAGNLRVETGRLTLLSGSQLNTDSMGSSLYQGPGGHVTVYASESVFISGDNGGRRSGIQNGTRSDGDAGSVFISTPFLRVEQEGQINSATGVFGEGDAGEVVLELERLELASGGGISTASVGYGAGGSIDIRASDAVVIDDGFISAFGASEGVPGRITINAPEFTMRDGLINTETAGTHAAGSIEISAGRVSIGEGAVIQSIAHEDYPVDAGAVRIEGSEVVVADSLITTESAAGGGGDIAIHAGSTILLGETQITASVYGGAETTGGNLTLAGGALAMLDHSTLTATATEGRGGHITIGTEVFLHDRTALAELLDASSGSSGNDGVVEVNSPELDLSGSLVGLPADYLNAADQLSERCGAARAARVSSFVVKGRGAIPVEPGAVTVERLRAGCRL